MSSSPKRSIKPPWYRRVPWKWIGVALLIAALMVSSRLLPMEEWLTAFQHWLADLGPLGYLLFILGYVLATLLFIPGWPLTVGAGFAFGLVAGTAMVSFSSTLGAALAFLIARHIARKPVADWTSRRDSFQAIDKAIGREGWKLIFLLRLSPLIPFNLSNYFYGITAVRFWPSVLASWLGMMPGTILYVYLGAIGRAGLETTANGTERGPLQWILLGVGLVSIIAVTVWVARIARRALRESAVDSDAR